MDRKKTFLLTVLLLSSLTLQGSIAELRRKAKSGNIAAGRKLAMEYFHGRNIKRNYVLAGFWFKKAGDARDAEAKYNLALLYEKGYGVRQSHFKAYCLYKEAAKELFKAKFVVAGYLSSGIKKSLNKPSDDEALMPDIDQAKKIYRELIKNHNHIPAKRELALLLLDHKNTEKKSNIKAVTLLRQAATANDSKAMRLLADCYLNGTGTAQSYEKMIFWLKKAAQNNNIEAIAKLGYCYLYGHGTSMDRAKAFRLLKYAAENNLPMAMTRMGDFYLAGEFVKEDAKTAIKWYRKAAEKNNPAAMFKLGNFHDKGIYLQKSATAAARLYHKAALLGHSESQYRLAEMLITGNEIPPNPDHACFWFKCAAEQNHPAAQRQFAICLLKGLGTVKNSKEALKWFRTAAKNGDRESIILLQRYNEATDQR